MVELIFYTQKRPEKSCSRAGAASDFGVPFFRIDTRNLRTKAYVTVRYSHRWVTGTAGMCGFLLNLRRLYDLL